jgi:hypothetical protein
MPVVKRSWSELPGLAKFAFTATAIWLLATAWVIYRWWPMSTLEANQLGDFVAGAMAPLAFLWLAIAVILQTQELGLQRQELKQSREALELQAKETRALVQENAKLAEIASLTLAQQQHAQAEERLHKTLDGLTIKIIRIADKIFANNTSNNSRVHIFDTSLHLNQAREKSIDDVYSVAGRHVGQILKRLDDTPEVRLPDSDRARMELPKLLGALQRANQMARDGNHETVLLRLDAIDMGLFITRLKKLVEKFDQAT